LTEIHRTSDPAAGFSASAELHRFRQAFYLLLSQCFAVEIDEKIWTGLADLQGMTDEFLSVAGVRDEAWLDAARRLDNDRRSFSESNAEGNLTELAREYAGLFLGVGEHTVSLCESQYHKSKFYSNENPLFAIHREYASSGLEKNEAFKEPDDHLAMELAFMAHLCGRTADAASDPAGEALSGLSRQRDFLETHLLSWVPAMAEKLKAARPAGFYASASEFLCRFLDVDQRLTSRCLTDIRP